MLRNFPFHDTRKVTYLTAAGNELTGEGLDGVRPLRDLKVFNASGNRVRRIPPTVFAQFRQLQALVLNNNEIAEVPPTWFKKGLLTLNTIVLSHNRVRPVPRVLLPVVFRYSLVDRGLLLLLLLL